MATLADLEALIEAAKAGRCKPLILLYGDQDYLVRQAYDRLLEALVPADLRAFNLEQYDGARAGVQEVLDAFNTLPLMAGPKAVGVLDARFFQSKSNAGEVLEKARARWVQGEPGPALRQLGRVLVLAGLDWESAQGATLESLAAELGSEGWSEGKHGGDWLAAALAQGLASAFPLPPTADDSGALQEGLEQALASGDAKQYLVCAAGSVDARKKLYKLFHERGHALDFKAEARGPQASQTARAFLANLLKSRSLTLRPALGERMVAAYGHDLGLLERELEKLRDHAYPRTELGDEDLAAVGGPRPEESVFEFLGALGKRDLGGALRLLRSQLRSEEPHALFNRLAKEVRQLAFCKALIEEGRLPGRGGDYSAFKAVTYPKLGRELPPHLGAQWKKTSAYPLYLALQRCRAFDTQVLRDLQERLLAMDLALKSSGLGPEQALEELCLRLCGVKEETYA